MQYTMPLQHARPSSSTCAMVSPPRYWRRLQAKRALRSAVITSAESFGVSIAKRFLPSVAVDAYRFRGMSSSSEGSTVNGNSSVFRWVHDCYIYIYISES